jgi:SAM-dependent methyltransferase
MRGIEQIPWIYDPAMALLERGRLGAWRRATLRDPKGRALEVGCGTGRNLPLYPPGTRVVATDPDLVVLRRARSRDPSVPFVAARAEALPFATDAFDSAVSTFVFCSVDEPAAGLAELGRVLRSDGALHMMEHVRSENRALAWLQDRVQPLWTVLSGGCRPNRDTVAEVRSAGFRIDEESLRKRGALRRFVARPRERVRRPGSKQEVQEYYRTVGRFIEMELAGRDDSAYWSSRARELGRPRVLELGAGTGRVTRVLAPLAERVVAVDLSGHMLAHAREALRDAPGVHLVLADMRQLALARTFDLVVAANDPFIHLPSDEERDRVLRLVASHLRPGGLFILDSHWLRPAARRKATSPGGWRRERSLGGPEAGYSVLETWHLDPETWTGRVRYEYRREGRPVGSAVFHPRLWSPDEVRARFSAAGLQVRTLLGSYDGRGWEPETASCLLVEAVRAPGGGKRGPENRRIHERRHAP